MIRSVVSFVLLFSTLAHAKIFGPNQGTGKIFSQAPDTSQFALSGDNTDLTSLRGLSDGTAGSPVLAPSTGTDNGIYFDGANDRTLISSAGTERLRVHSSGVTVTGTLGATNLSGTNTGDVTIGTANGLSLASQVLSLSAASATDPGAVTTGAQTIAGLKTFSSAPIISPLTASRVIVTDTNSGLAASSISTTTLGFLDATSSIQTQLNAKAPLASPTFTGTITTPLTASRALVTGSSSELAVSSTTATQIGYLSTLSSNAQTQIDAKAPIASPTFTGSISLEAGTGADTYVRLRGNNTTSGVNQYGVYVDSIFSSSSTSTGYGITSVPATVAASFTQAHQASFVAGASKGAGSTITRHTDYFTTLSTQGSNNAVIADNASYSGDYFINSTSTRASLLSGNLTISANSNLPLTLTGTSSAGTVRFINPASSTKYNWIAGGQYNENQGFEITPSTAVDGTTFSNPLIRAYGTGEVTLGNSSLAGQVTFSGTVAVARRDTNGQAMLQVRNEDTGASAFARLAVSSDQGDVNLRANSAAAGDSVQLTADSTFAGGFQIGILGSNPLAFYTGGTSRISIAGGGDITMSSPVTITVSAGDSLVLGKSNDFPSLKLEGASNDWSLAIGTSGEFKLYNNAGSDALTINQSTRAITIPTLSTGYAVITNGSNELASSSTSSTALGYISTLSSNAQTQLNAKVADTGDTMTGQLIITTSSGPQLRVEDGGTFATNADPYISFRDASSEGGRVGFDSSASSAITLRNLISGGVMNLQTYSGNHIQLKDSSTGHQANFDLFANTSKIRNVFIGSNTSDYGYVGYNARSTTTGTNWEYDASDTASVLYLNNGGFRFYGTSTSGTAGNTISFTNLGSASNAGLWTIGPTGYTGTHVINGNVSVTGVITGGYAEVDDGNSSTADTIDWSTGSAHKSTLTGNVTYTFTAPSQAGTPLVLRVLTGAGSYTATWPASVKWAGGTAPTITTTASRMDLINFYYDGTNYYGSYTQNYTP